MTTHQPVDDALQRYFGFTDFRAGQREVIEHLMAGKSAAAVFPTGSGKSLCYQLPAILLDGLTLVVSPLIALMKDQIDALRSRGILAHRLDSTLAADQYRDAIRGVQSGELRLLYVAPERFNNERFRQAILGTRVSLFAVDEAHCISEWGHNFRPDYLKLAEFARLCQAERTLALTATATPEVLRDICRGFAIKDGCATCTGFYRPNLTLVTTPVRESDRDHLLRQRLQDRRVGPTIVYVTLQRTAEKVAQRLARAGFDARPYHAGMESELRSATQDWFLSSEAGIVVATIAFGMGVDKQNIRYVYHYNPPKSLESYSQEIGRAGRDGQTAVCEMLFCSDDLNVLENFAYGDTPTQGAVQDLVNDVFDQDEQFDISYYELSAQCDIRILVVRTLLTYLELEGYLEGGTPYFSSYRFKPRLPSRQILARFHGDRRDFIAQVLRQACKVNAWFKIDLEEAAQVIGAPRQRVVRALDYLGQQQFLEVATSGLRHRYRRLRPCTDREALAGQLHQRTVQREQREIARLHQVVQLVGQDNCQVASLCAHFGEQLSGPCGHCTWCLNQNQPLELPPRPASSADLQLVQQARHLQVRHPFLAEPHVMTRFLCGVSSPRISQARLASNELFGIASHVPYTQVLQAVKQTLQ